MLPSDLTDRIYAAAHDAQIAVIKLDSADAMKIAGVLNDTMLELMTLVRSATTDIAGIWNDRHPNIVSSLPVEVRTACFRWLCPGDVLRASHVCRSWRDTALSEARLWSIFHFDSTHFDYNLLELYVKRSCSVKLSISVGDPLFPTYRPMPVTHRTAALLLANAFRMRSLTYYDGSLPQFATELLANPLPLLEELVLPLHLVQLPTAWHGGAPPVLRVLEAEGLDIPDAVTPLPTVTSLACRMDPRNGPTDVQRLFDAFPRLKALKLFNITNASSFPLPLPQSLRSLTISSIHATSYEYLLTPAGWIGSHRVQINSLTLYGPTILLPAIQFFIRGHSKPWKLEMRRDTDSDARISMQYEGEGAETVLLRHFHVNSLPSQLYAARLALENLASVTVTYYLLSHTSDTISAHRATHLEVVLLDDDDPSRLFIQLSQNAYKVSLGMPRLETLVFTCSPLARMDWLTPASSKMNLCRLVTFTSARLKRITVSVPDPQAFDGHDWSGFKTYVDAVTVERSTQYLDEVQDSALW
ncbi:hypothetical protein EXIGLDRAFT_749473 [Exidia glandulosa HHB12029]|uniref:F-box domain-containing protein n=1 Tax=Exidia glandulosa HHB12029 TaxID=1314781 RepID=A0A165I315_EXIGL|nr:hypothetical protein EXIGLDRAFT_749473 [Exidia glandulosa HHB12029]